MRRSQWVSILWRTSTCQSSRKAEHMKTCGIDLLYVLACVNSFPPVRSFQLLSVWNSVYTVISFSLPLPTHAILLPLSCWLLGNYNSPLLQTSSVSISFNIHTWNPRYMCVYIVFKSLSRCPWSLRKKIGKQFKMWMGHRNILFVGPIESYR